MREADTPYIVTPNGDAALTGNIDLVHQVKATVERDGSAPLTIHLRCEVEWDSISQ
ncbi:hypothetical protein BZL29_4557 [Mycobacterium kansasii]|uniref:Uncharacterized protein n=1 Tax=Mycobacterium kansasii TaxID=1768 RepID=A0A1V3X7B3_MYCKA|nr:hypothetical protein BZL29_4557 [Mycobacterium kansasii]